MISVSIIRARELNPTAASAAIFVALFLEIFSPSGSELFNTSTKLGLRSSFSSLKPEKNSS